MISHTVFRELVDARFDYESLRGDPDRIPELGTASLRLLRARQAAGSPRVHSAR